MRKVKFKAGDKVYCPSANTKISIVGEFGQVLALSFGKCHVPFDGHGVSTITQIPTVFHATAENHTLLEKLYGIEFEAPSQCLSAKEIMKKMFDGGWHCINYHNYIDGKPKTKFITKDKFNGSTDYRHAVIFDPKTGKIIIDYVDGEIVTE